MELNQFTILISCLWGKNIWKKNLWLVLWYLKYDHSSTINIFYYDISINLTRTAILGKIWLLFWRLGIGDVPTWSGYIHKSPVESKRTSIWATDIHFDTSSLWVLNGKLFRTSGEPCILLNKTPRPRNYWVVIYWHENELPVTVFYCRNNLSFCLDTCFIALDDYYDQ